MKKILYFSIAALAVAGCAKELQTTEVENTQEPKALNTYTITAGIDAVKANLDEDLNVLWQAKDSIGLVDANGVITPAVLDEGSVGKSSGTFTYQAEAEIEAAYAYYPYTSTKNVCNQKVEGTTLTISLAKDQNMSMDKACISKNNLIMAGKPDEDGKITFKNACAIARIKLSGKENYARRVYLQTPDRKVSGEGTLDLSSDAPVFVTAPVDEVKEVATSAKLAQRSTAVVVNPWNGSDNRLHVTPEGTTATQEGVDPDVYVVLPAGEYTNLCIETLGNTDPSATAAATAVDLAKTSSATLTFNAGKIRTVNVCLDNPTATDLGKRANCFLIENTDGGNYCFTTEAGGTNYNTESKKQEIVAKSGYYSSLLWEDAQGLVTNVRNDNVGKKIYFTLTEGMKGNAVIALRARDGKIQWSWHIWVAGETVEERTFGTNIFMDRNLGATAAVVVGTSADACGLNYQWGRKDPFPGIADFSASGSVNAKAVFPNIIKTQTSQNGQAITWATALPYVYIWGSANSGAEDWCNAIPQDNNQWGNVGTSVYDPKNTKHKTIYDPCPYGYRTAGQGTFSQSMISKLKDAGLVNKSITIKDDNGNDFVIPCSGYWRRSTNSTTMCNVGTHGWIWTMTSSPTNDILNTDYIGAGVFQVHGTASNIKVVRKTPRRWGANVRCVKFDEDAIVVAQ